MKDLGLCLPTLSHGIFSNIVFDGEWKSPDICFLFNMELVQAGYFYAAYGKKSSKVSFGIMNDVPTDTALVQRFIGTGLIPELQDIEIPTEFISGTLGSVAHVQGGSRWPVPIVVPRVIVIGEAAGAIGSYIRSGLFESRFQGHLAARVMVNASKKGDLGSLGTLKPYEQEFKAFDERVLRYSRQQHYAMYHAGSADAGNTILDSYLKALNSRNSTVVEAMRTSYLEDVSMGKFELGQFGAIASNIPFASKLGLSAHLVAARMQP
jgi:flavin-dependent dehydrogenase